MMYFELVPTLTEANSRQYGLSVTVGLRVSEKLKPDQAKCHMLLLLLNMSALAARRAAAAIAKAPHDVSGDVIDRSKASSQPKKASVPTEKPVSESSANDKISSNGRKRRRLEESSPKAPPAPARVVLSSKPPSKSDKGKRRAFSPSAPVSDFDDSSDEADSNNGQGEVLDGNNATWSGAVTPAIRNSPGPSRPRHAPIATSSWVPQRGVNLYHLDVDRLSAAGILSDHSGVAIRLAPGEVSRESPAYTCVELTVYRP